MSKTDNLIEELKRRQLEQKQGINQSESEYRSKRLSAVPQSPVTNPQYVKTPPPPPPPGIADDTDDVAVAVVPPPAPAPIDPNPGY